MRIKTRLMTAVGLTLALTSVVALTPGSAAADEKAQPSKATLTKVETKKVCMVNNQVFEKDQIPVVFENRTYYGCCEMCKERLAKDSAARTALDPVTGKQVDKATALIAALPNGSVLYFENEASFERYSSPKKN
jgi:YHS domain-containing protein